MLKKLNSNFYLIHISQTNEIFRPTAGAFDIYASNQAIGMSNNEKSSNGKLNQCLVATIFNNPNSYLYFNQFCSCCYKCSTQDCHYYSNRLNII